MSILSSIIEALMRLFGHASSASLISQAEVVVIEATEAWLRNLAAVGVQDGAKFIAEARELSRQINAENIGGAEKLRNYVDAAKVLLVSLGGDLGHTLTESVTRTAAELLHQPDAGTPDASARTLGSTEGKS